MARNARKPDIDAISASVPERFDEVPWSKFNALDRTERSATRDEVLRIRADLMKVASVDPDRAAKIWDEHVPIFVPRPFEFPAKVTEMAPVEFNTIEPGRKRRRTSTELYLEGEVSNRKTDDTRTSRAPATTTEPAQSPATQETRQEKAEPNAERIKLLLAGLDNQYLKADNTYHFRDRDRVVAFEAQEKKLVTQHETPAVVSSMIDLAETRGWSSLRLTGTEEFKREAWLHASLRDFEVGGYRPNKLDKARLAELRTERASTRPVNAIEHETRTKSRRSDLARQFEPIAGQAADDAWLPLTPTQDQFLRVMEATMSHRGDSPAAIKRARALADERLTSDRIHVGQLVSVGTAPYQDKRGETLSHFIELQNDKGEKTKVWGVDLPRALEASGAEPGQMVAAAFRGRQRVSVDIPVRDGDGQVIRTERRDVHRNSWEIVRFDKLREEAKASVLKAVHRQDNPAELKVLDRSAGPSVTRPPVKRPLEKGRERAR